MAYQIVTTPAARRAIKKLPLNARNHLIKATTVLSDNPHQGQQLQKRWRFLRSFHTRFQGTDYRVVYEIDSKRKLVIIRFAASRENFYRKLHEMKLRTFTR